MASRNIAIMHLFLEMKKQFPHLPEDTLRNYVYLYAEDRDECIRLLQKENKNHSSQPFLDFCLTENKEKKPNVHKQGDEQSFKAEFSIQNKNFPSHMVDAIDLLGSDVQHSLQLSTFTNASKNDNESFSSQSNVSLTPIGDNTPRTFLTTTKHQIGSPEVPGDSVNEERHAVSLSITPSFPYAQVPATVYSGAIHRTPSWQSSECHKTSLNLQLQPSHPIEISSVPANRGGKGQKFGSHLQISIGSQGASFTALRFQSSHQRLSVSRAAAAPSHPPLLLLSHKHPEGRRLEGNPLRSPNSSLQCSPDYIQAVKQRQSLYLQLMEGELEREKFLCTNLKKEVEELEHKLTRKHQFPYDELLQRMREENRRLQRECNGLLMEYDISSRGQIPVGMTDEDFYSNIFTGPNDGLKLNLNKVDDEVWKCKKCTFENHPFLEKCEMCELPRESGCVSQNSPLSPASHLTLVPRPTGSVQIRVTSKHVQLHFTQKR